MFLTYPKVRDSPGKLGVIPDDPVGAYAPAGKGLLPWERGTPYQLVGEVMAHQGYDG